MKKIFKLFGLCLLACIILAVGSCLYFANVGKKNHLSTAVLSAGPRNPRHEIPVTYNIGWWPYQKELKIDSFNIEILESRLSLFNSKTLIAYNVYGHLNSTGNRQPIIEEVYISERINSDTTLHCDRIIEITPVVKVKENNKANGGTDKFAFKNEHIIISNHWGINRIKFSCGQQEKTIELRQVK